MTRQKTLIILTPGFPANELDTTCLPPRQVFVKALQENNPGLKIIVLAFQYPFFRSKYLWHTTTVTSFNGRNKGGFKRVLTWIKIWKTLKKTAVENEVIGILSFWMGECALIGNRFARKNKLKHFTWILGQDAKPGNKYFNRVRPKAESLIALSNFIAAQVYKNYQLVPGHTIPVGIDVSMFGNHTGERNIDILGAGSLIPLKQFSLFVTVIHSLSKSLPNIKAVICGKGPENDNLLAQIAGLEMEDHISLTGELPNPGVLSLMQRAKIFLHTSNYEGFGTVCAEALYAGAHVVSFCKPMAANIDHWHTVRSEEEMTERVLEILRNGNRSHDPVLVFPADEIAKQMMKILGN